MPEIALGTMKFMPDFGNKAPGLKTASGVLPYRGRWRPFYTPIAVSDAYPSDAGVARVIFDIKDDDGQHKTFILTSLKAYRLDGAALLDITRVAGGDYNVTGDQWDYTQFGQWLIAANLIDVMQKMEQIGTDTNLSALGGAPPKARSIDVQNDYLFAFNTDEPDGTHKRRVRWCAKGDAEDWTGLGSGRQDLNAPGEVGVAIRRLGTGVVCYLSDSVWFGNEIGSPFYWGFVPGFQKAGPLSVHSVARIDRNRHYFLGRKDVYLVEGRTVRALNAPVRNSILSTIDESAQHLITHIVDTDRKLIIWAYPTSGATAPTMYLAYNWETDQFSEGPITYNCIGNIRSAGLTFDDLAQFGTIADLPNYSFNSPFYSGGADQYGAVDTDRKTSKLFGTPLDGRLITGDVDSGGVAQVNEMRPIIETPDGTVTAYLLTRENDSVAPSESAGSVMRSNGRCDMRSSGRYIQHRLDIKGDHSGVSGLSYTAALVGDR
jgi:hypothetical protein